MTAFELIEALQAMIDVHGNLEVLVETSSEVLELDSTIDHDRFEEGGQHYMVLSTAYMVLSTAGEVH